MNARLPSGVFCVWLAVIRREHRGGMKRTHSAEGGTSQEKSAGKFPRFLVPVVRWYCPKGSTSVLHGAVLSGRTPRCTLAAQSPLGWPEHPPRHEGDA